MTYESVMPQKCYSRRQIPLAKSHSYAGSTTSQTSTVSLKKIKENVASGEVVLLSPGSSSQDQYVKFEDRGDEFKNIVEKI